MEMQIRTQVELDTIVGKTVKHVELLAEQYANSDGEVVAEGQTYAVITFEDGTTLYADAPTAYGQIEPEVDKTFGPPVSGSLLLGRPFA